MIEDILYYLKSNDFKNIDVNVEYLKLFQKEIEGFHYILALLELDKGKLVEKETYDNILRQIKETFHNKYENEIKVLTIIVTPSIQDGKSIIDNNEMYWIIDTKKTQLIIYENQPMEFLGIKKGIEGIIDRKKHAIEYKLEEFREEYHVSEKTSNSIKKYIKQISPYLIFLNVLVYLMYNTGLIYSDTMWHVRMGGMNYEKVIVGKEYYRILTAMFIHFDINHLINNMLMLFVLGDLIESGIGRGRFLIMYGLSGIMASILSGVYHNAIGENVISAGASGAIYGLIGAILYYALIKKDHRIRVSGTRIALFAFFTVYNSMLGQNIDNAGHIFGFVVGFLCALIIEKVDRIGKGIKYEN